MRSDLALVLLVYLLHYLLILPAIISTTTCRCFYSLWYILKKLELLLTPRDIKFPLTLRKFTQPSDFLDN